GRDGKVREVQLNASSQGSLKTFQRPIREVVLLLPTD
ncbi:putative LOC107378857-like protein, partial [Nothobranchius furzeri]